MMNNTQQAEKSLMALIATTAIKFRRGEEASANACYQELLTHIQSTMSVSSQQRAYLPILERMLQAQSRHDWLDLADTIEYELTEVLQKESVV